MSIRATVLTMAAMAALAVSAPAGAVTPVERQRPAALASFGSCQDLVRYGMRHLRRYRVAQDEASGGSGGDSGGSFSPTNVQEAGVDEPDMVKTDGDRIYTVAGGRLQAVDVTGERPRLLGSVAVGGEHAWDHQLFLRGDRILLMWGDWAGDRDVTVLAEVDASVPAEMRVVRTHAVDGYLLDARMTGTTARVAVQSTPQSVYLRRNENRRRPSKWLPRVVERDRVAGTRTTRRAVGCREVRHAKTFSGLEMVTVVTVDFAGELDVTDTDTLMTAAETVYASHDGLYLATAPWRDPTETTIHRFDTTNPIATSYAGSGVVHGTLLNQFALSEHDGVLRAATTGGRQSFVTTLRPDPATGALTQVGRLDGLGLDERIYAVRFMGDVGYVVTFRETDPLYTVDLADPAAPRVVGELKIEGYSAYLHPVGDGRLLGVGQDATREGRRLGTQVSLFDVSDLAAPKRLAQVRLGEDSSSEVEWDHHAFLWWPQTSLAVLPVWRWDDVRETSDAAAVGLRVGDGAIGEVGRVEHPGKEWTAEVRRSLVVGDTLYTLSSGGLMASRLETLEPLAWLPLG